jgi:hypothetical protein
MQTRALPGKAGETLNTRALPGSVARRNVVTRALPGTAAEVWKSKPCAAGHRSLRP